MKTTIINSLLIGGSLLSASLLTSTSAAGSSPKEDKNLKKPNILWIVADDLGTDLGCYGNQSVITENLDRLAGEGILFSNCHTVTAVCSPSRSGLITGMYPVSINCHQHRTRKEAMKKLPKGIKTITEYFEEAGYYTFNGSCEKPGNPGKEDYNFITDYEIYDGVDWRERKEGQPFFGQIQIHKPHRPFRRDTSRPVDPSGLQVPPYWPDHSLIRQDMAFYLETVQLVDREVGKILERLKKDGLEENTYVFFVGDQGSPMVRHKQFLYDGGTNTPLIVRFPKKEHAKEVREELISNIDLAATALQLAGINIPAYMQGQNFLGAHKPRTEVFSMRDRRDESVDRIRAIRTGRFKYIRNYYPEMPYTQYNAYKRNQYPCLPLMEVLKEVKRLSSVQLQFLSDSRPEEELYDLSADPYEIYNLAEEASYRGIKQELKEKLEQWLEECDRATYPEDQREIDYWKKQMAKMDSIWKVKKRLPLVPTNQEYVSWWEKKFESLFKSEASK
ncbi:sulfatase family protein [Marinifilum flexuosum]|uniref:sulfatase family protein n=1 Tax=Marinifilum flexuosum TaxID=1117708 RepID=UPI002492A981|nr:sulfatase [Marinifilum flexuosum]